MNTTNLSLRKKVRDLIHELCSERYAKLSWHHRDTTFSPLIIIIEGNDLSFPVFKLTRLLQFIPYTLNSVMLKNLAIMQFITFSLEVQFLKKLTALVIRGNTKAAT